MLVPSLRTGVRTGNEVVSRASPRRGYKRKNGHVNERPSSAGLTYYIGEITTDNALSNANPNPEEGRNVKKKKPLR
jgi:hypothetical protein